jgi:glycosyltransferase involved in cell wall biosynthesis
VVQDGVDGLLFEKANITELAERLERVMADPDLRKRLGAAARERVARDFSGSAYLGWYTELIGATLAAKQASRSVSAQTPAHGA